MRNETYPMSIPSHWESGFVEANSIRVHYIRTGDSKDPFYIKPPLICLHAFLDNGLCWTAIARTLQITYDVIMLDARGHGLTELPTSSFTNENLVLDVVQTIEALGLIRPALLGHAMGASTAALIAEKYPDLISCVILEDPGWGDPSGPQPSIAQRDAGLKQMARLMRERQAKPLATLTLEADPRWSEDERIPWAVSKRQFNLDFFANPGASGSNKIPILTVPTLLITADPKKGAIVKPEVAAKAVTEWSGGEHLYIENAGHCIRRDQFDAFVFAVAMFLDRHCAQTE